MAANSSRRMKQEDLHVDRGARSDWMTGDELVPSLGQQVYCTEGLAEVTRLLGKTSDGSRLIELKLIDQVAAPFFAAASNVLVEPAV